MFKTLTFILGHPLNQRNKLGALKRFVSWQLKSRIVNLPMVYPFIEDSRFIVKKGVAGLTGNIYCGLHEFEEMSFLLHYLRPGDSFADVGANVGSYSILAGKVCQAEITCFEPIPNTYSYLLDNLALNKIDADSRNQGVGAVKGQLKFIADKDTMNRIALENEAGVVVEVVTLDDVYSNKKIPALMKIDVEGYEEHVLKGGERLFSNPQLNAIIIEINGSGDKYGLKNDGIHTFLLDKGFKPFKYLPFERKIVQLPSWNEGNTIYIRNSDEAFTRVKSARKFSIHSLNV